MTDRIVKVNNLLREVDLIKNDFIKKQNDARREIKALNEDLLEVKRTQEKMEQKLDLIIKELKRTAATEEVQVIKKYLEYWNPLNFVTQRDLDRALDAKLASRTQKENSTKSESRLPPSQLEKGKSIKKNRT